MTNMDTLNRVLANVSKPARYTGGELGEIIKQKDGALVRLALCFPDIYEVGMSHLGISILYHLANEMEGVFAERCFAPWSDMELELRKNKMALFSLETKTPLCDFDIVGFSLGYEMCYTNVLNMLNLGNIALLSKDRGDNAPIVIAGGGCAYNPEPVSDFIDLFVIGEAEQVLPQLLCLYKTCKRRSSFMSEAALIEGVYVPSLYEVQYKKTGAIRRIVPSKGAPNRVLKRIVEDFDKSYFPQKPIVPYINTIHDRITLEIMRGCTRGCRFCQAGFVCRPLRERQAETLIKHAHCCLENTGHEEISLCSLSTGDYSQIGKLVCDLSGSISGKAVALAVPSLRVDSFDDKYVKKLKEVRNTGLTFAPEAGTQRLRDVINKNITEESIMACVTEAFSVGVRSIKLYFMLGLPSETMQDVLEIAKLAQKIRSIYYGIPKAQRSAGFKLTVSVSCFVPKPHTPFQWEAMQSIEQLEEKQHALRNELKKLKGVKFSWHDAKLSKLEAVFARGDRRLSAVLIEAYRLGCRFDSWKEHFDYQKWQNAFYSCGIDPNFYANRERPFEEILAWDMIDSGISKEFLWSEKKRAEGLATTPDCRQGCQACGLEKTGFCV